MPKTGKVLQSDLEGKPQKTILSSARFSPDFYLLPWAKQTRSLEFPNSPTLAWPWCCSPAPPSSSCPRSWRTFPPVTQSSCGRQPSVRHSPGHLLPQPAVLAPRCSCHLWQQLKAKTTQARGKPTGSKPGGLKLQHKSDKNTPVCETSSSKEKSTGFQWAEGSKRAQQVFFPLEQLFVLC